MLQKIQKYLRKIHNSLITNKLSLQLEALSNCDKFTVITILYNNVLIWDYKNNNKYQVTMSLSIKQFHWRGVNILVQDWSSREINKDSFNCNLNGLLSFKSIKKLSKLAL